MMALGMEMLGIEWQPQSHSGDSLGGQNYNLGKDSS